MYLILLFVCSLRRKIQNQEAERSDPLYDKELGIKISPSMRSYLDKHPPINVEGKTYVPLGKMSKFDSLAQMVWSGFGKRQRKAEAEQQSASSLEEEVFHPSTTGSVARVKSRNKRLGIFYFIFPSNFTGVALLSAHG